MKAIIVKKWIVKAKNDEIREASRGYSATMTEAGYDDDGNGVIPANILKETEKAMQIEVEITDCTGNDRTWNLWLPKSQIIRVNELVEA